MTKVSVIERHYNGTRDIEGSIYDRKLMDTESEEFGRYMQDFGVLEKYKHNQNSPARSYLIKGELQFITGDAFFSGWVPIYLNHNLHNEMCYIVVENIEST